MYESDNKSLDFVELYINNDKFYLHNIIPLWITVTKKKIIQKTTRITIRKNTNFSGF